MDFDQIKRRLSKLDTACLCDANKGIRVMDPGIRPIRGDLKMVGRARTVLCQDDFLTVIKALHDAEAGEVLVIDGQAGRRALAGELFSMESARKGLAGLVVDGAVRDSASIHEFAIPVYSRHVSPMAGTAAKVFTTQKAISCGGVTVQPGDIVFGDRDGVMVASLEEMVNLIPAAEAIQAAEARVLAAISGGISLFEVLNFDEHYERVLKNLDSKLRFTAE